MLTTITHTIKRVTAGLALALSLATLTVPTALAGSSSRYGAPDGWYPYAVSLTKANIAVREHPALIDGRSPDTKDAALAAQQQALTPVDGRSPDTRDAARAAQAMLLTPVDGRSPDTRDAAILAHTPVVTVDQAPGFHWGDFAIGIAAAFGLMLIVSIGLLAARHGRKQPSPVATA
jgi:hypothetical protein